jgi:hypothetical protein
MEELRTFKDQLALVKLQLEADPGNEDLLALKSEFEELISLTEQAAAAAAPKDAKGKGKERAGAGAGAAATVEDAPAPKNNWQDGEYAAGKDCMAKYKDGKWYVFPNVVCSDLQVPRAHQPSDGIPRRPDVRDHVQGLHWLCKRSPLVSAATRPDGANPRPRQQ